MSGFSWKASLVAGVGAVIGSMIGNALFAPGWAQPICAAVFAMLGAILGNQIFPRSPAA